MEEATDRFALFWLTLLSTRVLNTKSGLESAT